MDEVVSRFSSQKSSSKRLSGDRAHGYGRKEEIGGRKEGIERRHNEREGI
jgi:hypothetical protein